VTESAAARAATVAPARPSRRRRVIEPFEVLLRGYGVLVYLFLYIPILIVVIYSFNDSKQVLVWGGFSTRWYASAFADPQVMGPLRTSLVVASINAVLAVVLGTLAALAIGRAPRPFRYVFDALVFTALIVPEVVIALSSLLFLNGAFGALKGMGLHVGFGIPTIVAGHVLAQAGAGAGDQYRAQGHFLANRSTTRRRHGMLPVRGRDHGAAAEAG
jgi:ABC-type spermidine/putrescine transport system permease subunit II